MAETKVAEPTYDPFPNQAPTRPPDPPPYKPVTPLDHAVEAFIESMTPGHQRPPAMSHPTMELRKDDLRVALKQFAGQVLADQKVADEKAAAVAKALADQKVAAGVATQGVPNA